MTLPYKVLLQFCPDQYMKPIPLEPGWDLFICKLKVLRQDVEIQKGCLPNQVRSLWRPGRVKLKMNGDLICLLFYMFVRRKLPWLSMGYGALLSWLHKRYWRVNDTSSKCLTLLLELLKIKYGIIVIYLLVESMQINNFL